MSGLDQTCILKYGGVLAGMFWFFAGEETARHTLIAVAGLQCGLSIRKGVGIEESSNASPNTLEKVICCHTCCKFDMNPLRCGSNWQIMPPKPMHTAAKPHLFLFPASMGRSSCSTASLVGECINQVGPQQHVIQDPRLANCSS